LEELKEIIRGCILNDRISQEKLYRRFYPALFCLCRKFFADEHEALGVLNDGMMKVFRNLSAYDQGKGELFNWIYTIVRNTALDKLKAGVPDIVMLQTDDATIPEQHSVLQELEWKDVYVYLDQLPPATRVVFSLFYLEGYKIPEIGKELQISTGTVKWHLSESRKMIQPFLKKHFLC
jgi:RNA polymerase sigma factor (sigma-70 family)